MAKTAGDTIRSSVGRRYTVYFVYGEAVAKSVTYIGITKDFIQRLAKQYKKADRELHPIFFSNLTKAEARGVEQQLIELYGLRRDKGSLTNIINSVSPRNEKEYTTLMNLGRKVLQDIKWPGF